MKELFTKESAWALSGTALLFAGAATALLAAPETNQAGPASTTGVATASSSPRPSGNKAVATNVAWTTYRGNAQRTGTSNIPITLPLGLQWRYSSEAEAGPILGSPLILNTKNGRTVIYNAGRSIFALSAESGEMLWTGSSTSTLRAPLALIPNASGGTVLKTSSNGVVEGLRAVDGVKLWSYKASAGVSVAPTLATTPKGTRIIVTSNDGNLVALTTAGVLDPTWKARLGTTGTAPIATPSLDKTGKRLMVSGRDGYLYIINLATARILQAVNLGAESPMSAIDTGNLIVTGTGNTAVGIRTDNNSIVWRTPLSEEKILSVSLDGNTAYFATNRGSVVALNIKDGKQVWKSSMGRTSLSGTPLILPNMILVGGRDSILYAIDKGTGKVTWRYRVDTERSVIVPPKALPTTGGAATRPIPTVNRGPVPTSPTNPANVFAAATPVATPIPVYELRTYGISSAPAIVDGQLILAADNGALYSFATSFFDGAPPSVASTQIVVPTQEGGSYSATLDSNLPGVPVKGPIALEVQLKDEGSGIDPARIRASFNGRPLAASDLKFNPSTGVLRAEVQKHQRGEANELAEGSHTLTIEAVDYSGNTMRSERTFKTSKSLQSPSIPRTVVAATPTPAPAPPSWRERWNRERNNNNGAAPTTGFGRVNPMNQ